PSVVSISRADPDNTNATTVHYTVTFSKGVLGLTKTNFNLVPTGVSGADITDVSGIGNGFVTTWTVTVNTGTGSGTLGLDLVNSTGVTDNAGNAVSPSTFTGEVYTIDKSAPAVSSFMALDPTPSGAPTVRYSLVLTRAVIGLSSANFTLFP